MNHPNAEEVINRVKQPIKQYSFESECQYEKWLISNIEYIFIQIGLPNIIKVKPQFRIRHELKCIIDILIVHADKSLSVIEAKCTTERGKTTSAILQCQGIGQLLLYRNLLEFYYGTNVRLFLVSNKIHYRTLMTFSQTQLPISLLEVNKTEVFSPYLVL